jgi:hypothetical protein
MKILFVATINPEKQGDYLELSLIHGLRSVLGENFVEYPRKKILYGDFSESPINSLHGKGFTYCTVPIKDVQYDRSDLKKSDFDVVLIGPGHMYGEKYEINHPNIWYTDGHDLYGAAEKRLSYRGEDLIGTQYTCKCFKRELIESLPSVYATGFGIPEKKIRPIDLKIKNKQFQTTAPSDACFFSNQVYRFDNEDSYYTDMAESWFGLTCKKGGWDCLRHYEIMACGALLLFKDYNEKPPLCEPNCPTISYSNKQELYDIINDLVKDNVPTTEYVSLLSQQREWLTRHGTCEARARKIIETIQNNS